MAGLTVIGAMAHNTWTFVGDIYSKQYDRLQYTLFFLSFGRIISSSAWGIVLSDLSGPLSQSTELLTAGSPFREIGGASDLRINTEDVERTFQTGLVSRTSPCGHRVISDADCRRNVHPLTSKSLLPTHHAAFG